MTLITHIWTHNINLISSDRRLTNRTLVNPIVSENIRKTYSNSNSFVSFHGDYVINDNMNLNKLLIKHYEQNNFNNSVEIANVLHNRLKENQNRELRTGLIIGGHFKFMESIYYHSNQITFDHSNYSQGIRMNSESNEHKNKLFELLDLSINKVTKFNLNDFEQFDNYSNDQFLKIITNFYERIHQEPLANPVNGIGTNFDLGIIRNGIFNWIINNDDNSS